MGKTKISLLLLMLNNFCRILILCCLDESMVRARLIPVFTDLLTSCMISVQNYVQEKQFDSN